MAEPTSKVWGIEDEDKLVEMWSEEPCLYDVCSREFKNRTMRDRALEKIASTLECTVSEVWRHMTSLRTQYGRAQQRPKSGSAAKLKTPRQKWLIDNLQFLSKSTQKQPSSSNMDAAEDVEEGHESAEEDEEKDEQNSSFISIEASDVEIDTTSTQSSSCTKRPLKTTLCKMNAKKSRDEEELALLRELTKIATQPVPAPQPTPVAEADDEDTVFAKWMIQEIRGIRDDRAKAYLKYQIQQLMFNFKYGSVPPQQGFGGLSVEPTYHHM